MEKQNSSQNSILIILVIIMIVGFGILGFMLYQSTTSNKALLESLSQSKQSSNPSVPSSSSSSITSSVSSNPGLTTFTDSRLNGFTLSYDASVWEPKVLSQEEKMAKGTVTYQGPGILFIEKNTDGVLAFIFTLAFGMGGGMSPLTQEDITKLQSGWARLQNKTYSSYGLEKSLVYYKDKPEDLKSAKDYCDQVKKGEDMYPIFDSSLCPQMESGGFIGYAPQPAFSRSPQFSRAVALSQINSSWAGDTYVKETGIDTGDIIVGASYRGNNPSLADKLVEQLKPL